MGRIIEFEQPDGLRRPDATIPSGGGIARHRSGGNARGEVTFEGTAPLTNGAFSGTVDGSPLPAGGYRV